MGSFNASLRTIGDRRGLPATVTIDGGRIVITAGDQPIGDWSLEEVRLEATGGSVYRMAADGDQILIEVPDTDAFQTAIDARSRLSKRPKVRTARTRHPKAKTEKAEVGPAGSEPARAKSPDPSKATATSVDDGAPAKGVARLDRVLEAAERRWGSLLPAWVFTRAMVGVAVAALVLTVIFPGLVSSFLLLSGLLLVLFGAVAYTDLILATKWLPGRMTAMHVLLIGVAVLMLGVLVGVVA